MGQTFRVSICAGAGRDAAGCDPANRQAEFLVVHMPAEAPVGEAAAGLADHRDRPEFRGVAIGGAAPKVALFARNGALHDRVSSFVVPEGGVMQVLIAGLEPGTYDVMKDGTAVASGLKVNAGDNSLYFESSGGRFAVVRK